MDDKILMNKNSLAALKLELDGYRDALPVFEMKEQQLKSLVQRIEDGILALQEDIKNTNEQVEKWGAVMAEEGIAFPDLIKVEKIVTKQEEIIGFIVESFVDIRFKKQELDYLRIPLWIDAAIEVVEDQKVKHTILSLEQQKLELLKEELAEARRMKNALKEVFIPEAMANIRKIEIYLGDVERLAIGCAKLVKKKKMEKHASA